MHACVRVCVRVCVCACVRACVCVCVCVCVHVVCGGGKLRTVASLASCVSADFLTVNETAKEPPQEEQGKNSPNSLAVEATYINQNFSQQVLMVGGVCVWSFGMAEQGCVNKSIVPLPFSRGSMMCPCLLLAGNRAVSLSALALTNMALFCCLFVFLQCK